MTTISAVIITLNEETNIGRCLDSLRSVADEVVVVDCGSTDKTEQICRDHGIRFVRHNWLGYAEQKNYANTLATSQWTLSIDADEALSDKLRDSLLLFKTHDTKPNTAYSVARLNNYCGRWIHHCGWYPDEKVRLWPTGSCHWDGEVHETLVFDTPLDKQRLDGDLLHYTYTSFADHASRQLRYALLAAEKAHNQGRHASRTDLLFKPAWAFLRSYLLRGGFLDGHEGYLISRMAAYYTLLKYARLRELSK